MSEKIFQVYKKHERSFSIFRIIFVPDIYEFPQKKLCSLPDAELPEDCTEYIAVMHYLAGKLTDIIQRPADIQRNELA